MTAKDGAERNWVRDFADYLFRELIELEGGFSLRCKPALPPQMEECDVVYTGIEGACGAMLAFVAERPLFLRLARNMICGPEESEEDVRDYVKEFFNVFSGRFISELYRMTGAPALFCPPEYRAGTPPDLWALEPSPNQLIYESDQGRTAVFAWRLPSNLERSSIRCRIES